jgi:hypothetical protein
VYDPCHTDDKVALDANPHRCYDPSPRRIDFFIYIRVFHVCSSHSSYGVFSLAVVNGHPVLMEWVFELEFGC